MALILAALPAGILILVNGNCILPVALVHTLKSSLIPLFLLFPTNAPDILSVVRKHNLSAHHWSAPPLLPPWLRSQSAPARIIVPASYLVSRIACLQSLIQGSSHGEHSTPLLKSLLWFPLSLR